MSFKECGLLLYEVSAFIASTSGPLGALLSNSAICATRSNNEKP